MQQQRIPQEEPSPEWERSYAERIVEQLLGEHDQAIPMPVDLVVIDIARNAIEFNNDIDLLQRFDADIPAIVVAGDLVPVSLRVLFGPNWPLFTTRTKQRESAYIDDLLSDLFQPLREDGLEGMYTISRDRAHDTFVRLATFFLEIRIDALEHLRRKSFWDWWSGRPMLTFREGIGGREVTTPGCNFRVTTNSNGLRVHWSGAYYISANYFNHPTSPVKSVLQAGTYIFGVDGGAYGNEIQWDTQTVVTLPGMSSFHLNY